MPDARVVTGYLMMIAIVAAFVWLSTDTGMGGDPSRPQLVGWSTLQGTLADPLKTLNVPSPPADPGCGGFDIGCQIGRIGSMLFWPIQVLGSVLIWFFQTLINLAAGLFGVFTLTFSPPLPIGVQVLLWAIAIPGLFNLIAFFLGMLRGTEG